MSEFQATIDFSFQLNKFVNIDLFQRGLYQVRLLLKLPNCKLPNKIEIHDSAANSSVTPSSSSSSLTSGISDASKTNFNDSNLGNIISPACVVSGTAVSKTFQIVYKNEEVLLNDNAPFRVNICLDSNDCMKQIAKIVFLLQVELWFTDQESPLHAPIERFECVSTRHLQIHFDLCRGLHYNLPVIFDYFHLSAITLTLHGSLVTLCQPYICKSDSSLWLSNFVKNEIKEEKKMLPRSANGLESDRKAHQYSLQMRRLQLFQWRLVSIMVSALLTLRRKINEYYRVLPPWQQARVKFEPLFVDIALDNLSPLSQECFKGLDKNENVLNISTLFVSFQNSFAADCLRKENSSNGVKVEDMLNTIERDLSFLCALTIDQWQRFMRLVNHSDRINQHLAKVHHLQRIKRFAEGFFCLERPRSDLYANSDETSSVFCDISDFTRKSSYFTLLPPCEVECTYLDGDATTLPIIYEQNYEPMTSSEIVKSNLRREIGSNFAVTSSSNSLGYFSSPSKHSLSSESTSSSNSSSNNKSNIRSLLSRLNYIVNDKNAQGKRDQMYSPNKVQELKSSNAQVQVNAIDFLGLYSNDLFKDDETNFDQVNRRIKLLNSFLNKKEIIKSYSKMSLDYSDKKLKQIATENQSTIVHMLRNTISLEQPVASLADFNRQSIGPVGGDKFENSRSWPNLTTSANLNALYMRLPKQHRSASFQTKKSATLHRMNGHAKKSSKSKTNAKKKGDTLLTDEVAVKLNSTTSLMSLSSSLSNYQGTAYFPKPPKEFAMEGIDEPAEEVNMKPIPITITEVASNGERKNGFKGASKLKTEPYVNGGDLLKAIDNLKIRNSSSCQDLTGAESEVAKAKKLEHANSAVAVQSKDDAYLKCTTLTDSKFTFLELLRSDHCLVCCGNIKNRIDQSWPCVCNRSFTKKKPAVSESGPPSLRRVSAIGTDLLSFLHAKEEFRNQISKKDKNLLFYSDFHTLASRIPYFQCDPDFRAFNSHKDLHLIVCVHGLDGNSADLRLVRTYLELGLPTTNFDFLMSQRNQGETFDSLETLTSRLVNEIDNYVMKFNLNPARISFIGHSLGNIIIRSAISRHDFMRKWRDKLHTFLSLSGPHLGLSYNRSGLVNMGLWFIQKFKKSASLTQLSMKDAANIRQTFLYQLSTKSGLEHFRHILLCGSSQDFYVPIHSAHIELCNAALSDSSENGVAYREMANNILERLVTRPNLNIVRYDVHHALTSNANSLIGRAAHIAVLDSELFIEKFMVVVGLKYFV